MTTKAEAAADEAAEAIREINHLTISYALVAADYAPNDLYRIVGSLDNLVARLPQALQQLGGILDVIADSGQLRAAEEADHDPIALAAEASVALEEARGQLGAAQPRLAAAHAALAWLYVDDGTGE